MKPFKNTSLYSRLALITSITLVVGYFVVYAAWTTINPVNTGDTLTKDLINNILSNANDLNDRVSNFGFSAGNVGIGTASPTHKLEVTWGAKLGGTDGDVVRIVGTGESQGLQLSSSASSYKEIQSYETEPLYINRQGNNVILNATSGKVWIGTTTPGDTLTVNGGVTANSFTSATGWSVIPAATGWTSNATCRRIGSFLQIKGYVYYTTGDLIPAWGAIVATLPVACRPSTNITYPAWSCWNNAGTGVFACFGNITAGGDILLYSVSSFRQYSFAGTYPVD